MYETVVEQATAHAGAGARVAAQRLLGLVGLAGVEEARAGLVDGRDRGGNGAGFGARARELDVAGPSGDSASGSRPGYNIPRGAPHALLALDLRLFVMVQKDAFPRARARYLLIDRPFFVLSLNYDGG